ncbi:uncharacterized protein N7446_010803 [Penicillium canescens]|uniref:Uncharacterized protein n=1 Tax=Penicillium canescens TaxID=5083 RepID=A0AAD6IB40_PENCN|nr:uncharacterized protein N7446_010803 [Penicillium canescens]KAJ6041307.1 hypothetical protein N7460_006697 [Penicillium canescens]KAJ6050694.1 hypothetical protein N7446_010803 [Penicillium canescens]KAJ6065913.1 hypothetical protein N7444_001566 [Penicillium canescens]
MNRGSGLKNGMHGGGYVPQGYERQLASQALPERPPERVNQDSNHLNQHEKLSSSTTAEHRQVSAKQNAHGGGYIPTSGR